jgi:hypothetical protein
MSGPARLVEGAWDDAEGFEHALQPLGFDLRSGPSLLSTFHTRSAPKSLSISAW